MSNEVHIHVVVQNTKQILTEYNKIDMFSARMKKIHPHSATRISNHLKSKNRVANVLDVEKRLEYSCCHQQLQP